MELEEAITLGLAIAALVLSVLSIVFGIIFFRIQSEQAQRMAKDNSEFSVEMHKVLAEIKVKTETTDEQLRDNFGKVLTAALHGSGDSVTAAATSAIKSGELINRLDKLEGVVANLSDPGKAREEISRLRITANSLTASVRELAQYATQDEQKTPTVRIGGPPLFKRFSQKARRVLSLAEEEAKRFNHSYIGTEHILLGLVREGEGMAAKILVNLGVELSKVRAAVEFIIGREERAGTSEIGLTPKTKRVLELAVEEARRFGHHYIGTEHLLLGLLLEGEGVAAGIL